MVRQRLALVGLSSVGKSTIVAALHGKPASEPIAPTQGCNKSTLTRHNMLLDLLDLGGAPQVRKFWSQLASDVHAIVVVANAAEADDMNWAMLASEVQRLRGSRPLLVLLNRRDVSPGACASAAGALSLLGVDTTAGDVHVEELANSVDADAAEMGLDWLCGFLLGGAEGQGALSGGVAEASSHDEDDVVDDWDGPQPGPPRSPDAGAASSTTPPGEPSQQHEPAGRAPTRLRVMQALRDARQYQGEEAELAAALAQKLSSGHLLSEDELGTLRRHQQRMAAMAAAETGAE